MGKSYQENNIDACLFLRFSLDMQHCQQSEKGNVGRRAFSLG